jgi:hypothetical protein
MSQFPNYNQPGTPPNPFAAGPAAYQPPKSSNAWLWILLGVGGAGLLVCCGCGGFGYFAMNKGFEVMQQDLQTRLSTDPVAQQHLGQIESVTFDFGASITESQERGGDQVFVFHVKGSNGSGDVIGNQPPQGGQTIRNPKLILPSGEEVPLSF